MLVRVLYGTASHYASDRCRIWRRTHDAGLACEQRRLSSAAIRSIATSNNRHKFKSFTFRRSLPPVTQTVVAVQQMRPVVQPVMQDVNVTEYQAVKRQVSKPVVTTEYVDQLVTEMRPVSELKTVNVPTVDYQTVTEYKTVQKQMGYWVTKNVPTNRVSAYQYDNRPNAAGAMNRASYNMRNAFTPTYQQQRQYVPQTMTCTVPYCKKVAVPGMKQVTYNISRMQPTQTTRKVAVNKVTYQTAEVTVMAPVQTVKTMQVGTRVSYAHPAGNDFCQQ